MLAGATQPTVSEFPARATVGLAGALGAVFTVNAVNDDGALVPLSFLQVIAIEY